MRLDVILRGDCDGIKSTRTRIELEPFNLLAESGMQLVYCVCQYRSERVSGESCSSLSRFTPGREALEVVWLYLDCSGTY